ncbi:MAG: ribonuclease Z [Candidatus Woesearchaeota archaeon]
MIKILFLGTSSMVPTKDRNHTSILLKFKEENILIDCGEGTQRQLKIANEKVTRITKILITHWHGDHVLGIPGLLQTMAASNYQKTLLIFGPDGTKKFFENIMKIFVFNNQINYEVREISKDGVFYENEDFKIEAYKLEHKIPCLGYRFVEKDKRKINVAALKKYKIPEGPIVGRLQRGEDIVYNGKRIRADDVSYIQKGKIVGFITDTNVCENCLNVASDADILISEATFKEDLEEKALEYSHLTVKDAAYIATRANVKKLVLTHFSQRYKGIGELEEEAKKYFKNSVCAYDFMRISL